MTSSASDQKKLIVAIAVNIVAGQLAARSLGLPRWAGSVTAGTAMALASQPETLPPLVRGTVDVLVLPGKVVAQLLNSQGELASCCANCSEKTNNSNQQEAQP